MSFTDARRGVLQGTRDQTDHLGRVDGDEGRSSAAEVVKTHRLTELFLGSRADDIVDPART
jgi:hypothetical protein